MNALNMLKDVVGGLTGLAVSVIVFGVAANIAFGGNVPFVGETLDAALAFVNSLGDSGLVGLLIAGWLMTKLD
tara:strand:- start:450 stop:668 length:219 start_codon:yes stop_codon:yes gene_type:complete